LIHSLESAQIAANVEIKNSKEAAYFTIFFQVQVCKMVLLPVVHAKEKILV
jgi:hypothetical protein